MKHCDYSDYLNYCDYCGYSGYGDYSNYQERIPVATWKYPPQGTDCCGCAYDDSDGSEHSDAFSTAANFTASANWSIRVVSNELVMKWDTAGSPFHTWGQAYRSYTEPAGATIDRVMIESDVEDQGSQGGGVFWDRSGTPPVPVFAFIRHEGADEYRYYRNGTEIWSDSEASGWVKMSLEISDIGDGDVRVCLYVDEVEVYTEDVTHTLSDSDYGLAALGVTAGFDVATFDNFTAQVDTV